MRRSSGVQSATRMGAALPVIWNAISPSITGRDAGLLGSHVVMRKGLSQ